MKEEKLDSDAPQERLIIPQGMPPLNHEEAPEAD